MGGSRKILNFAKCLPQSRTHVGLQSVNQTDTSPCAFGYVAVARRFVRRLRFPGNRSPLHHPSPSREGVRRTGEGESPSGSKSPGTCIWRMWKLPMNPEGNPNLETISKGRNPSGANNRVGVRLEPLEFGTFGFVSGFGIRAFARPGSGSPCTRICSTSRLSMNRVYENPKRRRNAALQDAGATTKHPRTSATLWSAPVFRRFGRSIPSARNAQVHGPHAHPVGDCGLFMNRLHDFREIHTNSGRNMKLRRGGYS